MRRAIDPQYVPFFVQYATSWLKEVDNKKIRKENLRALLYHCHGFNIRVLKVKRKREKKVKKRGALKEKEKGKPFRNS